MLVEESIDPSLLVSKHLFVDPLLLGLSFQSLVVIISDLLFHLVIVDLVVESLQVVS